MKTGIPTQPVRFRGIRSLHGTQELSVHQRIRFRRPSGQGVRPHFRRSRRSVLSRSARGRHGSGPGPGGLRNDGDDQSRGDRRRNRGPSSVTPRQDRGRRRARPSRTSATSRPASTGRPPRSKSCCTGSRPTSRRASMPARRRTKVPATRASCSAMPATRRRN